MKKFNVTKTTVKTLKWQPHALLSLTSYHLCYSEALEIVSGEKQSRATECRPKTEKKYIKIDR